MANPAPTSEHPLGIEVGMTWDECVPILNNARRVELKRESADQFRDTYEFDDRGFALTFARPSSPDLGPYRLVQIESVTIPIEGEKTDLVQQLKRGLTMNDVQPVLERIGGHFVLETRDRFRAVLKTTDGTYEVAFERPSGVTRPDVIAEATPEDLARSGRIPFNALPEFGEYRIVEVKKEP